MKNKISTIILAFVLSLPITVWAVDNTNMETISSEQKPVINQLDEDIIENDFKQPVSKRKIIKKFLYAMGGVTISSFAIFFLLTIYNRIRSQYTNTKTPDGEVTLETPENYNNAIKIFLEKTKW